MIIDFGDAGAFVGLAGIYQFQGDSVPSAAVAARRLSIGLRIAISGWLLAATASLLIPRFLR